MITEVRIQGFRSLGQSSPPVRLQQLNFLVGANASGKSNFVNALRFLQMAVVFGMDEAFEAFGGVDAVRNRNCREGEQTIKWSLVMEFDPRYRMIRLGEDDWVDFLRFSYEVAVDVQGGGFSITQETAHAELVDSDDSEKSDFLLQRDTERASFVKQWPLNNVREQTSLLVPEQERSRLALTTGFYQVPLVILRSVIKDWRFFSISADAARSPSKADGQSSPSLGSHGENLPAVLKQLRDGGVLPSVIHSLRGVVPGLASVDVSDLKGESVLQVVEENLVGALGAGDVSDGTVRLLALLALLSGNPKDERPGQFLAIEGPEIGLHPHISEQFISILRGLPPKRQVLVTTHNPEYLNYLQPEELILFDKRDGITQMRHASDVEDIQTFRKRFSLGELWVQGALGATP